MPAVKIAALFAASMCSIAVATSGAISRARAVGSMLVAVRTNRSSAKRLLRRDRAWLIAGCDRPILPAARVTARSFISASNAFSRLRSTARISIGRMHIILSIDLIHGGRAAISGPGPNHGVISHAARRSAAPQPCRALWHRRAEDDRFLHPDPRFRGQRRGARRAHHLLFSITGRPP